MNLSYLRHLLFLSVLAFSAIALTPIAYAQEIQPGDTCTAGETDFIASSGGPETLGTTYILRCDGANWEQYGLINETSTFFGDGSNGVGGVAIGDLSFSSASSAVAIGKEASAGSGTAIAIGLYMTASASGSVAIGNHGGASGSNSVAIGDDAATSATGAYALGDDTIASGSYAYALGKYAWAQAPRSYAFGYSTRIDPASNDTIAFNIGGTDGLTAINSPNSFIINGGNVGINDTTPSVALDVTGTMRAIDDSAACTASERGSVRYYSSGSVLEVCSGSSWAPLGSSSGPFEYSSSGTNGYAILSTDIDSANDVVQNSNCGASDLPVIGFTSAGNLFSGHHDNSGCLNSGLWTDNYSSWWGQTYSPSLLENGPIEGDFSGMYLYDQSTFRFMWYGETTLSFSNGSFATGAVGNDAAGRFISINKTRNQNAVQAGDSIGGIAFSADHSNSNGNSWESNGAPGNFDAKIEASVESGTIDTSVPTKLTFHTTSATGTMAEVMVLDGDGNLGIGDTNPSVALDVIGDIHYTGVLQDMSDMRFKENVTPLEGSLDKLSSLNGFSFTMTGDESGTIEYGVSAQEVQSVFPELVSVQDSETGALGVSYTGLIAPMIEAIKEQQAQIDALEAENAELRALILRVDELEAQLQALGTAQ